MLEATVEPSFVKAKDVNSDSAKESKNALFDCAYDGAKNSVKNSADINHQGPGRKSAGSSDSSPRPEQRRGDASAADCALPPVTIVDGGQDSGGKPNLNGKKHEALASGAKPPTTDGTGSVIGGVGQDGGKASAGAGSGADFAADPGFKPTPPEFQFSKEKTAAAALNMFAKDELDLNGDGFVNKVELSRKHDELAEAAKNNPKSKELIEKLQAVNYMTWDYDQLSKAHDDEFFSETSGITIYDLASTVSSVNKAKHSGN
ncbi:hypothetical protein BH11CYA1_BH11CYA1_17720 [soil metagenome]